MVVSLIFAGGVGERMNSKARPKQFLEIHGKPILIYTIEHFERHPQVDSIVVVCLEEWMEELERILERNFIKKVVKIVPGGNTGHESIYNGLKEIHSFCKPNDIVMIHDGVRPLISEELISNNIECTKKYGNAITISAATESIAMIKDNNQLYNMAQRNEMVIVRAPQTFYLKDIWDMHQRALEENYKSIDSASLCKKYGLPLYTVIGNVYNIKITSPSDYYIFKAIYDAQENLQIFGL